MQDSRIVCAAVLSLFATVPLVNAQGSIGEPGRATDGPNPLRNVYFGEQHLHTSNSPDAFVIGRYAGNR